MGGEREELRSRIVRSAFRVMESPTFVRLLQDRRVLNVLIEGMSVKVRFRELAREVGARIAPTFGLATLEDLRAMEHDLDRSSSSSDHEPK